MTVTSQIARNDYQGNGSSTQFPVTFRFLENSHLKVLRTVIATGVSTTLTLDAAGPDGYTVIGAQQPSGGQVTTNSAPAIGTRISILRNVPVTQDVDYLANDPFPAETHERALDKLTMIVQQQTEVTGRAIVLPAQSVGVSTELPGPVPLNLLRWNASGTALENGVPPAIATVADGAVVDATVSPIAAIKSSKLSFSQSGTGAVARTVESKLSDRLDAADFGVVANGVADDTAAMTNAIAKAKATARPLMLPAGTIRTTATLDISGVTLIGCAKGYRNEQGTVIQGAGTHDILSQLTAGAGDFNIGIHNVRIKNGLCGIKVRYMLHSHWSNVHITDCVDGIQFGNSSDAGGLFDTFDNIEVVVTGTALDVNGNQFVNANSFNQCFFSGDQYGARVRCSGGIGAVNNVFNCCEFLGARYGIELSSTKNTALNECYFESFGPSILLNGVNLGWSADDCVFAGVLNNNITGRNAFVYHTSVALCRGSVKGGYVYVPADPLHNNLSLFASEQASNFLLTVTDEPDLEVSASGFVVYNTLVSSNLSIINSGSFAPTWTGSGGNPSIGNGILTGRYSRSGNVCTATINLTIGNTTTLGSGVWSFGLPFPSAVQQAGEAWMRDAGTAFFTGIFLAGAASSSGSIYFNNSANNAGPNQPFIWAAGDELTISLTYTC